MAPLLQGVASFRQHEGNSGSIVRSDESEESIEFQNVSVATDLNREEMKHFNLKAIQQKITKIARQFGEAQEQQLLKAAGEAAESVGNVVHAGGELTRDKYLEVFRKVEMDFDRQTLLPKLDHVWVTHPDTAASVVPKVKEWEKDSNFKAEYERIIAVKREEWRDREANRKLVD